MPSPRRRRLLLALKAVVSLGLLGWLGARVLERDGVDALLAHVGAIDPIWLAVATALHFAAVGAGILRWRLLLTRVGIALDASWLTRSYLVGRFVGAFTPSTTGLDGWRLFEVGRASGSMVGSATAIGVEKLVGLVGMAIVCAALVPFGGARLMGSGALLAAAALGGGAAALLVLLRRPAWLRAVVERAPRPIRARAAKLVDALERAELDSAALARAVGLGVVGHLSISAVFLATARAIGIDADVATLLVVGNAITLAVLLPVSIGGVGVREGVAVVLLASAGVGSAEAVLVALLGYVTGQLPAVLGGVVAGLARVTPPSRAGGLVEAEASPS